MNPELALLIEVWDKFKSHVAKKDKLGVAEDLVRLFDEHVDIVEAEHELNELDSSLKAVVISHFDLGFDEDEDSYDEYE